MGFFSDLLDMGKDAAKAAAERSAQGKTDIVPYQNDAVSDFGLVLQDYEAGGIDNATARARLGTIMAAFEAVALRMGTSRAMAGLSDVSTLYNQVLFDLQQDVARAGGDPWGGIFGGGSGGSGSGVYAPGSGGGGGVGRTAGLSMTTLAVVGIGAWLLLRGRR